MSKPLTMRPYQLLCAMCAIGQENGEGGHEKLDLIRENPDIPLPWCAMRATFSPTRIPVRRRIATEVLSSIGWRDLEILQRLDLAPGVTLPARIILHRLWDRIESVSGNLLLRASDLRGLEGLSPGYRIAATRKGREICLSLAVPSWRSQADFSAADLRRRRTRKA